MYDENNFRDYVKSLSVKELLSLEKEIRYRKFELKLGGDSFYKVALEYDRKPICPKCKSDKYIKFGLNKKGEQRYQCKECKAIYNLMSSSIFNSIKKDLPTFYNFIVLLTYNIPLDMAQEILDISRPTALLWRHKIFETVKDYQEKTKLSGRVWIDEIYIDDPALVLKNGVTAGLSRNKICIAIGIDGFKNVVAKIIGNGKPTKEGILYAFKDVIEEGATLVHDADKSHDELIKTLDLNEEYYKAYIKDKEYEQNMMLINSLSSWIKRFIYRYVLSFPIF